MPRLIDIIAKVPSERLLLESPADNSYQYGHITDLAQKNKSLIKRCEGRSFAISTSNTMEFLSLLCLLDGHASRLLLLPSELSDESQRQFSLQAEVDCFVRLKSGLLAFDGEISSPTQVPVSGTEWVLATSGTSGQPKLVLHNLTSLLRTTKQNVQKGQQFKWGLVYDHCRFAGLQVLLQSTCGGSTLLVPKSDSELSAKMDFLISKGCNSISATPSMWRKLLMNKSLKAMPLKSVSLGGEIADTQVLKALSNLFPLASIRHIYASTEAGVGFTVIDGKAGFPLEFTGNGYNGVEVKIVDGRLWLKPSIRTQSYLTGQTLFDAQGYIDTGDLVEVIGDRVMFKGRDSGAINVGGNKVVPEEVERILLQVEFVSQARVFAKNSPILGSLVCAEVVLVDNESEQVNIKKQILEYCRLKLEPYKIPAMLKIVNSLNVTASGKLKR